MIERTARRMLNLRPASTTLVASIMFVTFSNSGCILPPEGLEPDSNENFPPEVDLSKLKPETNLFYVSFTDNRCLFDPNISASINDPDSERIEFRFVGDNNTNSRMGLYRDTKVLVGGETDIEGLIRPEMFATSNPEEERPHSISLFVSDVENQWVVGNLEFDRDEGTTNDFGALMPSVDGGPVGEVIEIRWTAIFTDRFGPGCKVSVFE